MRKCLYAVLYLQLAFLAAIVALSFYVEVPTGEPAPSVDVWRASLPTGSGSAAPIHCARAGGVDFRAVFVTAGHVTAQGPDTPWTLTRGPITLTAKVLAQHPVLDLALLEVYLPGALPTLPLHTGPAPPAGAPVLVAGYTYGMGPWIRPGALSTGPDGESLVGAVIAPGDSGGPVLYAGRVLGVTSSGWGPFPTPCARYTPLDLPWIDGEVR